MSYRIGIDLIPIDVRDGDVQRERLARCESHGRWIGWLPPLTD